jgi:hypothetical protein
LQYYIKLFTDRDTFKQRLSDEDRIYASALNDKNIHFDLVDARGNKTSLNDDRIVTPDIDRDWVNHDTQ